MFDQILSINTEDPMIEQLIDDVEKYDEAVWDFFDNIDAPWEPVFEIPGDLIDRERHKNVHIELVKQLLDRGIQSVAIIRNHDKTGGYADHLEFSMDPNEDWQNVLSDCTYVKWKGNPNDLLCDNPKLNKKGFNKYFSYSEEWFWYEEVERYLIAEEAADNYLASQGLI